jgi:hypothetical protein
MADRVRDWRTDLVTAYSDLFHPHGDPPTARGWPSVSDGWRDLLERACVRIRAAVQADAGTFHAAQIKEKFGTLRFYWEGALSQEAMALVEEAIDLAEARSACTCEICGEPGRLYGGWVTTRCEAHAEGRRPIAAQPGDDIQVVERIVGKRRSVRRRRYDRETDTFKDIDPSSLGIEEE